MSGLRRFGAAVFGLAGVFIATHTEAACKINSYAELPVTVEGGRIIVEAAINGRRVKMFVDTGAFTTTLFGDGAEALGLGRNGYAAASITGIGGDTGAVVRSLKEFKLGNYLIDEKRVAVAVSLRGGSRAVGLIGQDVFGSFDMEFDLPDGVIRLLKPEGCTDQDLPYWASSYSQVSLDQGGQNDYTFHIHVALNGRPVEAVIDSGAPTTTVSPVAAMNAGLHQSEMKRTGFTGGVGQNRLPAYTAIFTTVSVGGETVHNVDLTVADMFKYSSKTEIGSLIPHERGDLPRVLLGADFLKSHRVLLSRSHGVMVFTYDGGPVFGAAAWEAATTVPEAMPPRAPGGMP